MSLTLKEREEIFAALYSEENEDAERYLLPVIDRIKRAAWCEGRDAAAAICDELYSLKGFELARTIRALNEAEK